MGKRTWWLIGLAAVIATGVGLWIAASRIAKSFEPMIRDQAIKYLSDRFHSDVQLASLHIHRPKMGIYDLLRKRGRGAKVEVDGEKLSMRFLPNPSPTPLFSIAKFSFRIDLGTLSDTQKVVDAVSIQGMDITIPPKGEGGAGREGAPAANPQASNVLIREVSIRDANLIILPKDKTRKSLRFEMAHVELKSVGTDRPMAYDAALTIPKPPGQVHSNGSFGPWNADEPGDSPLSGKYTFDKADLGIFTGIAGILQSTGDFDGTLDAIHARGEASVPDFRLKMAGTPVPLRTKFEVLVDGTNGNTILQPVKATLGRTAFTTTGAVVKHEHDPTRLIELNVTMPAGELRDLLRLAVKGPPFMEGKIRLKTRIDIPPLTGTVKQRLSLDGKFALSDAKFLRTNIQEQIDQLSRRGQGQPKNEEIDEVLSDMQGSFQLSDEVMTFEELSFAVPGAQVMVAGKYDLAHDMLDFHGALRLVAKLSQTMTGWKRWVLKPADPFFSKEGAGTFLKIKIEGPSRKPSFGLDR
ncbi:MAG TPA: AsmA-like C-terminal region-containing protein [Bryobacteraceae bacterium]|nr:AsmA-like C-terminal region-containing protein [Bryobacteraceae bacterium]